jgi:hypothetical protein
MEAEAIQRGLANNLAADVGAELAFCIAELQN